MSLHFSESINGYPRITVTHPNELVGEFLQAAHTVQSAKELLDTINDVIDGNVENAKVSQDYAVLTLSGTENVAHIWIDFLPLGKELEVKLRLVELRDNVGQWLDYLSSRAK